MRRNGEVLEALLLGMWCASPKLTTTLIISMLDTSICCARLRPSILDQTYLRMDVVELEEER